MSSPGTPQVAFDIFSLDPQKLADKAVKGLRTAFAIREVRSVVVHQG